MAAVGAAVEIVPSGAEAQSRPSSSTARLKAAPLQNNVKIPSGRRTWNPTLTSKNTTLGWGTRCLCGEVGTGMKKFAGIVAEGCRSRRVKISERWTGVEFRPSKNEGMGDDDLLGDWLSEGSQGVGAVCPQQSGFARLDSRGRLSLRDSVLTED